MKGSTKAILWVILVFATGAIFGSVVSFLAVKNRVVETVNRSRGPGPDTTREQRFLQRMLRQLDLDSEQEKEMRVILERSRQRVKSLEGDQRQRLRQVRHETMREIRGVLRPEQQDKLEDFLKRLRHRSRQEKHRRGSPDRP